MKKVININEWLDQRDLAVNEGKFKAGQVWIWKHVDGDKEVEITDIKSNGDVIGRVKGTSDEFIVRDANKWLKKKVSESVVNEKAEVTIPGYNVSSSVIKQLEREFEDMLPAGTMFAIVNNRGDKRVQIQTTTGKALYPFSGGLKGGIQQPVIVDKKMMQRALDFIEKHAKHKLEESVEAINEDWGTYDTPEGNKVAKDLEKAWTTFAKTVDAAHKEWLKVVQKYRGEAGKGSGFRDSEGREAVISAMEWFLEKVFKTDKRFGGIDYGKYSLLIDESVEVNEAVTLKKGDIVKFEDGSSIYILGPKGNGYDYKDGQEQGHHPKGWFDMMISSGKAVVESAEVHEARSINRIQKDFTQVTSEMATIVGEWKAAKQAGDAKAEADLLAKLKELTAKKKGLEREMDEFVMGKDKDLELAIKD